jgi:hypothetical protein
MKVFPKFQKKPVLELLWILAIMWVMWIFINRWLGSHEINWWIFLIIAGVYNLIILWISLKPIKAVAKGLTVD